MKIVDTANGDKDVSDQYEILTAFGSLVVNARTIVIHTPNLEKEYDGTPLKGSLETITVTLKDNDSEQGLIEGHTLTGTLTGEVTDYGDAMNVITDVKIIDSKGNDVTKNYTYELDLGTLEII